MVFPRRAKCPLTGLGAMRRELEPFKRQLAQGRRHLADSKYDDVSKYRREREDNQVSLLQMKFKQDLNYLNISFCFL